MSSAWNTIQKRRDAEKKINEIFKNPDFVNVIHYSCESFYDREDGKSSRITSIAVKNLGNEQTKSFSIHQMAEIQKIPFSQIEAHYDELEKAMLNEFYDFVERHSNYKWLHWNMRDINYGFPALEHRFSVLGGKPVSIDEQRLLNLANIFTDKYGPNYVGHPRMESLRDLNDISPKDALSGGEEAEAFENKEYIRLHQSTLRKVNIVSKFAEQEWNGSLKTKISWWEMHRISLIALVDGITDSVLFKALGALSIVITVVQFSYLLLDTIF
ncbi:hypothetical protein G4Y79_07385 [Phototrophicus methaneseepsis]|uniref:Uncharacterized protein n=1 Tax=Phototrophicus methaneseepsis TaxID=2710758 RepID=A0A7S8EC12_9CHLR|nr:hypothetical protein [Phototrophicus methaneseepsis]QPC84186.1 hypothetical protein G4Y79_07385 [Phototrophicus methaneseepsis]